MRHRGRRPVLATSCALAGAALLCGCGGGGPSGPGGGAVATAPPGADVVTLIPSTTARATGSAQQGGVRTILAPLGINLRSAPSTSASILGSLAEGTVVTVTGHTDAGGGWYQVQGETRTGWITADPQYSSPRHFNSYGSQAHQLSLLYPEGWTFSDTASGVTFRPQAGGATLTVTGAPNLAGLGQPGRPGYGAVSGDTIEVFGVTGVLRIFERGAGAPPATSAPLGGTPTPQATPSPQAPARLAEILLAVSATSATRIDFDYTSSDDLDAFRDIVHSMKLYAALPTPTPAPPAPPSP